MSGFAGVVHTDGAVPESGLLERMAALLTFRGPDATCIWSRAGAGFCFTLLRTGPAPQSSEQPCTLDGHMWLLGDVRLDGREDLLRQLEQKDKSITAEVTDEALILRAWRRWSTDGFTRLNGDLSFALWDGDQHRLLCVRDLIGARPFFYTQSADSFYFSNTLEVLLQVPGVSSNLDPHFIGDFLLQERCEDVARTVYPDIHRLPAGKNLVFSDRAPAVQFHADFSVEEPLLLKRPEEYVERFQGVLENGICGRCPRVPCCLFIRGGLASNTASTVGSNISTHDRRRVPLPP